MKLSDVKSAVIRQLPQQLQDTLAVMVHPVIGKERYAVTFHGGGGRLRACVLRKDLRLPTREIAFLCVMF
jgi:hypothetical protein